ncbi:MAG: MBL fold metallo-hydrolase [Flavobacteriales bacterium]|nr:MBL fold metallo-hydrolase [Flavobacteriales bacterium]
MNLKHNSYFFLLATVTILTSCGRSVNSLFKGEVVKNTNVGKSFYKNSSDPYTFKYDSLKGSELQITYLGCGGFNIKRGGKSILIDPYFSNQPLLFKLFFSKLGFRTIQSDTATINKELSKFHQNHKASSIWVSHSHYDHLLDVPYVYEQYTNQGDSTIFCSQSGVNLLSSVNTINANNTIALNKNLTTYEKMGKQYYTADGTIRVTPIASAHAPHLFWNIKFYEGKGKVHDKYKTSLSKSRSDWWKEGIPLSFLFDFLDDEGNIEFRIFLQTSAAPATKGFIPKSLLNQHRVNLAIFGAASFGYVEGYPEPLLKYLNPERLIICHWEDFFVKYNRKKKKTVRFTNIKKYIYNVNEVYPWKVDGVEKFILPNPGTIIKIE